MYFCLFIFFLFLAKHGDSLKNVNYSISSNNNTIHSKKLLKDNTIYTLTDDGSEDLLPGNSNFLLF